MKRIIILAAVFFTAGCFDTPSYPHTNPDQLRQEAQNWSDNLENYIKAWMDGSVSALIPDSLLPNGYDTSFGKTFRLVEFDNIDYSKQLLVRPAHEINADSLMHSFPDPNCTYMGDFQFILPFGAKLVIEGEFPYARFFDIQVTPSFHPEVYHYGYGGEGEVPLIDADIEPLPGHTNPFQPGAYRNAVNRSFHAEFTTAIGNSWNLNEASRPPHRQSGNNRYVSGLVYEGPWADSVWVANHASFGHGRGVWNTGQLWIRYYAPDSGKGWKAGVDLPHIWYELDDGRKFYIEKDIEHANKNVNSKHSPQRAFPKEPAEYHGSSLGWMKQWDIILAGLEGIAQHHGIWDKKKVRELFLGITGRGEDLPGTRGSEPHKTGVTYINYLIRGMSLGEQKVVALTGKLPTFPDTWNNADTMKTAQMRYWSITGYDNSLIMEGLSGLAAHCIRDDQIVLNEQREYIIMLSRPEDRPQNATRENGITWIPWGTAEEYSWTLRWMTVAPEWEFDLSPDSELLPWAETSWSGSRLNPDLIATNSHNGILGEYLPRIHYMTSDEFSALGASPEMDDLPLWHEEPTPTQPFSAASQSSNSLKIRARYNALGQRWSRANTNTNQVQFLK